MLENFETSRRRVLRARKERYATGSTPKRFANQRGSTHLQPERRVLRTPQPIAAHTLSAALYLKTVSSQHAS